MPRYPRSTRSTPKKRARTPESSSESSDDSRPPPRAPPAKKHSSSKKKRTERYPERFDGIIFFNLHHKEWKFVSWKHFKDYICNDKEGIPDKMLSGSPQDLHRDDALHINLSKTSDGDYTFAIYRPAFVVEKGA